MKKEQIGINAGIIWKTLDGDITDTEISNVMKKSKLKKEDFYMALGWLARENKIRFHTTGNSNCIFLIY
ncbi:MAG: winged helix-turn-helix domain-containing protein [Bacteroidales bacterium]|jgi:hypothetical protein